MRQLHSDRLTHFVLPGHQHFDLFPVHRLETVAGRGLHEFRTVTVVTQVRRHQVLGTRTYDLRHELGGALVAEVAAAAVNAMKQVRRTPRGTQQIVFVIAFDNQNI